MAHPCTPGSPDLGSSSPCLQLHREELLRAAALHRLPQGPGLEVDPRAQGLPCQLLPRALSLHLEPGHTVQQGASGTPG